MGVKKLLSFFKGVLTVKAINIVLLITAILVAFGTLPESLNPLPFPPRELFKSNLFLLLCLYIGLSTAYVFIYLLGRNFKTARWHLKHVPLDPQTTKIYESLPAELPKAKVLKGNCLSILKKNRYGVIAEDRGDELWVTARKHQWGVWGSALIHLGMVVVLMAGLVTFAFSRVTDVMIPEGETLKLEGTQTLVRLEKFAVILYEDTDRPAEYVSRLLVKEPKTQPYYFELKVNNPLMVGRTKVFQMRYKVEIQSVDLHVSYQGEKLGSLKAIPQQTYPVPSRQDLMLRVDDVVADFAMDKQGNVSSRTPYFNNPGVLISLLDRDGNVQATMWAFSKEMRGYHPKQDSGLHISVQNIRKRYHSGVKLSYDPGVPLAYTGFILLVIGAFVFSFIIPQYFTLRFSTLAEDPTRIRVEFLHKSRKHGPVLKKKFYQFMKQLKKQDSADD